MKLHIDFETRSGCELKTFGLANYAADPTTGVHCMAWAFDSDEVRILVESDFSHCLDFAIFQHVRNGGLVYAHNAAFELAIWNEVMVPRYGWPELKLEQCRCTMAMAYAMGLPGKLEAAAPALGVVQRKDMAGSRVMLQLAKPREWQGQQPIFWTRETAPEKFGQLYSYCKQDVEVERAMHARLMELSPAEQELWRLDYQINQRGVLVDLPAIGKAIKLVAAEQARLNADMLKTTGGVVGSCTEVQLLVKWIKTQGVSMPGVAKADVLDALDGDLPPQVRKALELRKEAAKSSTAKLVAMQERASADGRVRGIHQYHGASTGRWAGRGIQTQNLPRPRPGMKPEDIEQVIAHLHDRDFVDLMFGPVLDAIADSVRGMIVAPPGKELVAVDFSAVEARVLAWLAGEQKVLDIFTSHGRIYEHAAAGIYHCDIHDVTKEQRQIGKVAVLALGYGGGVGAFQSMAKNYGIKVPDAEADQIKQAWRDAHPRIVGYWYELEGAAICAVREGGPWPAGPRGRQVVFKKAGSFLWCKLPSGRVLCYPYPELRTVTTPWGEEKEALTYMTVVSNIKAKVLEDPHASGTWKRISTYGGSLAENVTQAVARDLLAEAMLRFSKHGAIITAHVHDELVIEVDQSAGPNAVKNCEALMAEVPAWANGLPLAAEGWRGPRYRK